MATTVLDSVTPIAGARPAPARIEDPPAGLDWKAFSARCFPDRRRHDFEVVAAYFAYKDLQREASESAAATESVEVWEDEGGSTPTASPLVLIRCGESSRKR
jgi:hypothetical protein